MLRLLPKGQDDPGSSESVPLAEAREKGAEQRDRKN